jgi:hypothetical protein
MSRPGAGSRLSPANQQLRDAAHASPGVWRGVDHGDSRTANHYASPWRNRIKHGEPYEVAVRSGVLWLRWLSEAS